MNEKWILTVKELHLGHCKETFRAGAVIELDEPNGRLIIDGRRFNDTRDLDVLKRQALKFPNNPWIVEYSPEMRDEILGMVAPRAVPVNSPLKDDQKMKVIHSDEDLQDPIDIRSTKVSKIKNAEKEASRMKVKTNDLEIIRGDESVEDRLASLKGKNDMSSIAERARLKASGSVKMEIVHDDSIGAGFGGKNAVSMNAGQHLPSREEADAKKGDAVAYAEARKREADVKRKQAGIVEDHTEIAAELGADASPAPARVVQAPVASVPVVDAEKVALKQENSEMKERMDRMEKMMIELAGQASKRGKKVQAGG